MILSNTEFEPVKTVHSNTKNTEHSIIPPIFNFIYPTDLTFMTPTTATEYYPLEFINSNTIVLNNYFFNNGNDYIFAGDESESIMGENIDVYNNKFTIPKPISIERMEDMNKYVKIQYTISNMFGVVEVDYIEEYSDRIELFINNSIDFINMSGIEVDSAEFFYGHPSYSIYSEYDEMNERTKITNIESFVTRAYRIDNIFHYAKLCIDFKGRSLDSSSLIMVKDSSIPYNDSAFPILTNKNTASYHSDKFFNITSGSELFIIDKSTQVIVSSKVELVNFLNMVEDDGIFLYKKEDSYIYAIKSANPNLLSSLIFISFDIGYGNHSIKDLEFIMENTMSSKLSTITYTESNEYEKIQSKFQSHNDELLKSKVKIEMEIKETEDNIVSNTNPESPIFKSDDAPFLIIEKQREE